MASLTIRHVTTYRYRHPVAFGEHRMMLRPRDSDDQHVIEVRLGIDPAPSSLQHVQDAFGNHVAIAQFDARATELSFESIVSLEHAPAGLDPARTAAPYPAVYDAGELLALAPDIERQHPDPDDRVGRWARALLPANGSFELLNRLSRAIHDGFAYRRREAKGIQLPAETLALGHGSCRDFALLMIEAARALGFPARFASGYLTSALEGPPASRADGATHAWAQIYLPDAGWVDFDPTSDSVGKAGLVTVAIVRDPGEALPLHGTFIGTAADTLGMDVSVSVTPRMASAT
jgi:transglutaminase-like putative cysteine protease